MTAYLSVSEERLDSHPCTFHGHSAVVITLLRFGESCERLCIYREAFLNKATKIKKTQETCRQRLNYYKIVISQLTGLE